MKVLIVFYSRWGHTVRLAEAIAEGAGQIPVARAHGRRVAEVTAQLLRGRA